MDCRQKKIVIVLVVLAVWLVGLTATSSAQIRRWETFTSFNEVTSMVMYNGDVWVGTTGGLVRLDPETLEHDTYTNVDGLDMNRISCLCVDAYNRLWVGGLGRLVDFSDPNHPDGYLFTDRDDNLIEIHDLDCTPDGDSLWVANRLGVSLFLTPSDDRSGLILDTYTRFGDIERDTPARRVALSDDSVWIGTEGGLAVGSRFDTRLLKAPTGWDSYLPSDLSPVTNDSIRGLAVVNDTVYIGTTDGVFRFERNANPTMTTLGVYGEPIIYNMSLAGDTLIINSARGSSFYANGLLIYQPTAGMPIGNTTAGAIDASGRYWDGNLVGGIYTRDGDTLVKIAVGGTPGNDCTAIAAAGNKIWAAFTTRNLASYSGGHWTTLSGFLSSVITLEDGPLGEIWVGTFGDGVYRILDDSIIHFTPANSALSGVSEAATFAVVPDISYSGGYIWMANFRGTDGELVVVNPYDLDQWQNFEFIEGSAGDLAVAVVAGQGVAYLGSEENGIHAVDYGSTPFYRPDDIRWDFTTTNSGIGSNFIKVLNIDAYDTLWVGTAFGLSFQALGEIIFTNITLPSEFGPNVTAITLDGQGNLYAGSEEGLVIRDIATGNAEYLTTRTSGLAGDNIKALAYDDEKAAIWVATTGGISRITNPYIDPNRALDNIDAYPNPFVIRNGTETVRLNYPGLGQMRIFTIAGELVREIPINGAWDGRNAAGELVASGVYIFTLTTPANEVGRGKILLIRE